MQSISITTNNNTSSGKKTYQLIPPAADVNKKVFSKKEGAKTIASVVAVANTVANPATIIVNAGAATHAAICNLYSTGVSNISTAVFGSVATFYNSPLDRFFFWIFAEKSTGSYALPRMLESWVKTLASEATEAAETAKAAAETATSVNEVATVLGGISLAVQVPLVAVRGTKIVLGMKKAREIKKDVLTLEDLQSNKLLAPNTCISVEELLDRKSFYNKTQIRANALAVGGGVMGITGTAMSMGGFPAVVGIPMAIGGAVIGVKGSVRNKLSVRKENIFKGKGASHEAQKQAKKLRANELDITATKNIEETYLAARQALAQTKFFSLVNHVLHKEGESVSVTPGVIAQRYRSLNSMIRTGNKSPRFKIMAHKKFDHKFDRKTTLLDNELRLMHAMYDKWVELDRLSGTAKAIRQQMAEELIKNVTIKEMIAPLALLDTVNQLLSTPAFRKALERLLAIAEPFSSQVDELIAITKIDLNVLEEFIKDNVTARKIYYSSFLEHALDEGKRDMKYLRYQAAKAMTKMAAD